jgi:hypothetical protein
MTPDFRMGKRGAVLPLVLGILLAVTFLLTSLLQMPGGVRRVAMHRAQKQQQIYDAESALLAYLEGFPEHFFEGEPWNVALPSVERSRLGPWAQLSVNLPAPTGEASSRLQVLAGVACDSACNMLKSPKLRHEIYEGFKQQLNREITMVRPPLALEIKSGNRRYFGRDFPQALWVQEGDLLLDLDGGENSAAQAFSGRFIADGSIDVRGSADVDTLRVYARGPIYLRGSLLRGSVKIKWLEAFSEDRIEISRGVEFSGIAIARHEVAFPNGVGKAQMRYPSFVTAAESADLPLDLKLDSILIPDFIDGDLKPFEWRLQ